MSVATEEETVRDVLNRLGKQAAYAVPVPSEAKQHCKDLLKEFVNLNDPAHADIILDIVAGYLVDSARHTRMEKIKNSAFAPIRGERASAQEQPTQGKVVGLESTPKHDYFAAMVENELERIREWSLPDGTKLMDHYGREMGHYKSAPYAQAAGWKAMGDFYDQLERAFPDQLLSDVGEKILAGIWRQYDPQQGKRDENKHARRRNVA